MIRRTWTYLIFDVRSARIRPLGRREHLESATFQSVTVRLNMTIEFVDRQLQLA
jgi:hypothetical protein